ncbi:MAG: hypothetical protein PHN51_10125 [Candidatus Nanopelagicales bacterium]|nr:hypothetical protein [Candidatus Nanopelagicales bacterium]
MNRITIGLDYDGTVTSDPEGFALIAKLLSSRGHRVVVVTMRYRSECLNDPAFMLFVQNVDMWVATGREAKRPFCESVGVTVHVWIDDNPAAVDKSATEIWGSASKEGDLVIETHDNSKPSAKTTVVLPESRDPDIQLNSHRVKIGFRTGLDPIQVKSLLDSKKIVSVTAKALWSNPNAGWIAANILMDGIPLDAVVATVEDFQIEEGRYLTATLKPVFNGFYRLYGDRSDPVQRTMEDSYQYEIMAAVSAPDSSLPMGILAIFVDFETSTRI